MGDLVQGLVCVGTHEAERESTDRHPFNGLFSRMAW